MGPAPPSSYQREHGRREAERSRRNPSTCAQALQPVMQGVAKPAEAPSGARLAPKGFMASTMPAATVYLVAIDGTPCADRAVEVASSLGAALGDQAELHVVHVLPVAPPLSLMGAAPLVSPGDLLVAGRALLDTACTAAGVHFKGKIAGHLAAGEPWREIVQTAATLGADLVVVGTAGRVGIARMALGSVAENVVRHAGCPVLVVRPKDYHVQAEPGIEPPCADCVETQKKTARAKLWCDRHAAHHPQGRLHYELPPTFALGSMNFRP